MSKNAKTTSKFKLKIFRKNTRFKKFNVFYTKSVRNNVALRERRTGLKTYIIMSSKWAKSFLMLKKLTTLSQNIQISTYLVSHSYPEMLNTKSISQLTTLGVCKYALNTIKTLIKQPFKNFYFKTNKAIHYSNFNNWKNIDKLNSLGFTFNNVKISNNNYHVTVFKSLTKKHSYYSFSPNAKSLTVVSSNVSSLRALHIYMVILYSKTN